MKSILDSRPCDICGKMYHEMPCSIYKLVFGGKQYHMCSYTCYNKALEVKSNHCSTHYKDNNFKKEMSKYV